ncbi:PE family protein [Nocardia sp. NPDC049190]|uniref:PE family protein n=1 Tax=Nocardia sp. NPDC049190 TaxID=3155650 RepID=UPI0033D7FE23
MALNVDPQELVAVASKLAEMARDTGAALPGGWVVPAGADPISAAAVPHLNAQAASLMNGTLGVLNQVQRTAYNIGAAAADYTDADDRGSRVVGGSGNPDLVSNPVGEVQEIGQRRPPMFTFPAGGGAVDPLTFAQQLHSGPGPGAAKGFADEIRKFTGGPHAAATGGIGLAANAMQRWEPVGADAATELGQHRGWLDQLGAGLGMLADGIDTYSNAFRTAKAKHPTPAEIIAARKELVAAMRSKNELGIQAALAKFQEQNARSAETITGYTTEVGSKVPTGDTTGEAASSGGGDSSALNSMLPALMSAMASAGMPLSQLGQDSAASYDDYGYDDYGYDDLGIPTGLGSGGPSGMPIGSPGVGIPDIDAQSTAVGPLPLVSSAGSLGAGTSQMPRTPVLEPLGAASANNAAAARGGSPMMPYMPMSPGMGNTGGGNDRNRVVAWHPDRLMYVDDTPHTELVIGERPTIAPTVTPPTPAPTNQTPTQPGGNV